jgi:AcrR family transcriptional regulator
VTPRRRLRAAERRIVIENAASAVFAERGFRGASVEEIARRAEVSVPVIYDHFESKADLFHRLVDRHYAELRAIWFRHAASGNRLASWLPTAVEEWFQYVESHPFAGRMLFRNVTGDADLEPVYQQIRDDSRAELLPIVEYVLAEADVAVEDALDVELLWETMRAVLQGLALWRQEHTDVRRQRIVAAAMNSIWIGFDRLLEGEQWRAPDERHRPHSRAPSRPSAR